jgi:hypothetical protein
VAALVGDLVHADPIQPVQAGPVDRRQMLGHEAFDGGVNGFPGAPQQLRDRGLVHALREPGDLRRESAQCGPGRRSVDRQGGDGRLRTDYAGVGIDIARHHIGEVDTSSPRSAPCSALIT